jgi:hypothetical protein
VSRVSPGSRIESFAVSARSIVAPCSVAVGSSSAHDLALRRFFVRDVRHGLLDRTQLRWPKWPIDLCTAWPVSWSSSE